MEITKEVLVEERAHLLAEINSLNQDLLAKEGAVQLIDGLLNYLEKPNPQKEETKCTQLNT